MFALTARNFHGRILDCGADPASFDAEATGEGLGVVSCDPFYRFSAAQIRGRVRDSVTLLTYARKNRDRCVWDGRGSPRKVSGRSGRPRWHISWRGSGKG
jgi:hypothetical protein